MSRPANPLIEAIVDHCIGLVGAVSNGSTPSNSTLSESVYLKWDWKPQIHGLILCWGSEFLNNLCGSKTMTGRPWPARGELVITYMLDATPDGHYPYDCVSREEIWRGSIGDPSLLATLTEKLPELFTT